MSITISKTDLARNTRDIVDQARRGQTIVVQSYGEDQVVLLDAMDYRLLRALVAYALRDSAVEAGNAPVNDAVFAYLDERVSLAKAAELLDLSRFELMERFERLGVPLRQGPATLDEAHEDVAAARRGNSASA
ncbi:type II toxin-antitoxin system prevent-host-death family antitoxin [Aggregatilinea lenta]|uniref:type II toxin-antitoxin system prevent-host-death family antitoxin n=1 Tax=Aggregatilinea lenta TaxID=913108 RepID=UPI000E5B009B|nr:type II toxin-antitoxin system prevent-host-death family antitoxin [Aggregatilinea lenta]